MKKERTIFSVQNWGYIFKTMMKNKLRAGLTALGIIIGVWAVITLISIGNGLKEYVTEQFETLGSNNIFVVPFDEAMLSRPGGGFQAGSMTSFKEKDVKNIERLKSAQLVVPYAQKSTFISYKGEKVFSEMSGTTAEGKEVESFDIVMGRFFNSAEEKRGKNVIVLGWEAKEKLFGDQDPIDKKVKADNKIFKVIGVIEERGGGGFGPQMDKNTYLPYKAIWRLTDKKEFSVILAKAKDKDSVDSLKLEIKKELKKDYDEDDFSVIDQAQMLGKIQDILNIFTIALTGIAAISLIVGGVGIMNVMFVSVNERTREVGLRKAVGANNHDILIQFLAESVTLSVLGGTIGLILAIISSLIIDRFFPASITIGSVLLALAVSSLVGIIFGITPARKASKLSPVEALRYE